MTPRGSENLSSAVGHPTVDAPLGERTTPELKPARRRHTGRNLAVGAGAVIIGAAGVGVAINYERGTGPKPTENSGGGIVEPTKTPIPTPFPTENPTITLPPTPTSSPETSPTPNLPMYSISPEGSLKPEAKTLEQRLNDWVTGKIDVKKNQRFVDQKQPLMLNLISANLDFLKTPGDVKYAYFQGFLLGEEIVDNHIIAYFGLEDVKNNKFFIPVNYGDITNDHYARIIKKNGSSFNITGFVSGYKIYLKDFYTLLQQNNDKTFLYILYPDANFKPPALQTDLADINEFNAQSGLADKFVKWSFITAHKNSYSNTSTDKSLTVNIINKRVTVFNKDNVLAGSEISIFGDK